MKRSFGWLAMFGLVVGCSFNGGGDSGGCDPCESETAPQFVVEREGERIALSDVARVRENASLVLSTNLPFGVTADELRVEGPFELRTAPITVRALATGTGKLAMADSCARETDLPLMASEAATSEVVPLVARDDFAPLPTALWPSGIGLLPDGVLAVRARFYDAESNRLDGTGGEGWSGDGLQIDPSRALNIATVAPRTESLGPTAIHVVGNGALPVELVPSGSIDRLVLLSDAALDTEAASPIGTELELEQGQAIELHLLAYGGGGRLLFGDDGSPIAVSIGNDPLPTAPTEGFPLWGVAGFPTDALVLSGNAPGDAQVTIRRGGKSIDLLVHVTEAPPQPTSP